MYIGQAVKLNFVILCLSLKGKMDKELIALYYSIAELQRPKAAMQSPIPIEPVHLFSHGHLCQ